MSHTDYSALVEELDKAIEMDQVYVCRDILVDLDKAAHKGNVLVKKYYEENSEKMDELRENISKVTELLEKLKTENGWTKCNQRKETTVYFQKLENSPLLMTKVETFFPGQLHELPRLFVKLVAMFNETDLLPRWFPRNVMKSADLLKQVTKFSKIVNPKVGLPIPINLIIGAREAVIIGKGFDMSERSSVVITVTTLLPGNFYKDFQVPEVSKGYTQMYFESAFYFELRPNGIVFKLLQQIDLNSAIIPTPLMNWLSKGQLPFEYISSLKKCVSNFDGSIWDERVKANPHIYEEVIKRLLEYLKKELNFDYKPLKDTESVENTELDKMSEIDNSNINMDKISINSFRQSRRRFNSFSNVSKKLSKRFSTSKNSKTDQNGNSDKSDRKVRRKSRSKSLQRALSFVISVKKRADPNLLAKELKEKEFLENMKFLETELKNSVENKLEGWYEWFWGLEESVKKFLQENFPQVFGTFEDPKKTRTLISFFHTKDETKVKVQVGVGGRFIWLDKEYLFKIE